ncbi:MAG TPA: hypothetical protein VLF40_00005, partial [Candidatus Saccharimonadales bacterium]|nr:hypothetical protein [Candidatus Saccharimonadales bacterium]
MDAEETQSREIPTDYVAYLNQRTSPEDVQLEGVSVEIFPGVFRPATDAHLLAAHLGPYLRASESKAPSVLDTTSGSGILSAIAAAHGATGIALDINPTAVEN